MPQSVYRQAGNGGSVSGRGKIFFLSCSVQTNEGAHQPPIQWVQGFFSLGKRGKDVKLITQLHLLKRLRIVKLYFLSPIHLQSAVPN
jgi:hypothetical protein